MSKVFIGGQNAVSEQKWREIARYPDEYYVNCI
jgi:hypothetical protein